MRQFLRSLVWNLISCSALGAPTKVLLTKGVEVLNDQPGQVSLQTELECGERPLGVIIRESKATVQVGVVVERPSVRCSSAPVVKEFSVPFMNTKGLQLESLPAELEESRIALRETEFSVVGDGLNVRWPNSCQPIFGIILTAESSGTLGVAAAVEVGQKLSRRKAQPGECRGRGQALTLRSVDLTKIKLEPLARPGSIDNLYSLRVVAPKAAKVLADGSLAVTWPRRCREVAVGVLFSGVQQQEVGIVTAYLPNVACVQTGNTDETTLMQTLAWQKSAGLRTLTVSRAEEINQKAYRLRFSDAVAVELTKQKRRIEVVTSKTCDEQIGVVVGNDSVGNLAVSALKSISEASCRVRFTQSKASLPLEVRAGLTPRFFPLQVKGSQAH